MMLFFLGLYVLECWGKVNKPNYVFELFYQKSNLNFSLLKIKLIDKV